MTYPEVLKFILDQLPMYQRVGSIAYRASLDNSLRLDEYFGHPHSAYKTIHVGGTNGKGSVSHMLSSVLQAAGYRTGLHTSPHLFDFRERIKVNGTIITEDAVMDFVNKHLEIIENLKPSFFELSVFMALDYFKKQEVDVAIIEVGLGGRLDSTNVIEPVLSIITNISYDHLHILGNSLTEIAVEKAGIIKNNIPVIIGERNFHTDKVFITAAQKQNASILFAQDVLKVSNSEYHDGFRIFDIDKIFDNTSMLALKCDLSGCYQSKNIITVLAAIELLKANKEFEIDEKDIYEGMRNVSKSTGLMGRWQIVDKDPLIIFDTAHNQAGLMEVVKQINQTPHNNLHFLISMVNDKDLRLILKVLPEKAIYYFTNSSVPRAIKASVLEENAKAYSLKGKVFNDPQLAFESAKAIADKNDIILVSGSIFLVADLLKTILTK